MLCLRNAWSFQKVFLIILSLSANLKLMSVLLTHEMFLVYELETFTNCKEVKHIMVMIIAIIYIFLSYEIFDEQLKITFRKSSVNIPHPTMNFPETLQGNGCNLFVIHSMQR